MCWHLFFSHSKSDRGLHMRTFSQIVPTRLLSSPQFYTVPNLNQQPSTMPQDSNPYQASSTSTHVPSRANRHVAPLPSHYNQYQMKFNELPQNTLFNDTKCEEKNAKPTTHIPLYWNGWLVTVTKPLSNFFVWWEVPLVCATLQTSCHMLNTFSSNVAACPSL